MNLWAVLTRLSRLSRRGGRRGRGEGKEEEEKEEGQTEEGIQFPQGIKRGHVYFTVCMYEILKNKEFKKKDRKNKTNKC